MRKIIILLATIALFILMGACSTDDLFPETDKGILPETEIEAGRTITLTASMPDDGPNTRVSLTPEEGTKNIEVRWEEGDEIQFAIKPEIGTSQKLDTYTLEAKDLINGGKGAKFEIKVPTSITGSFHIYGVYGGGGITIPTTNANPVAILPTSPGSATSLNGEGSITSVQSRKDVMLYFEKEMLPAATNVSVVFEHLGSLFCITLKNTSNVTVNDITQLYLAGGGGTSNNKWAYNSQAGGKRYDFIAGEYPDKEDGKSTIFFNTPINTLAKGESMTVWAWHPILPGVDWPELSLGMQISSSSKTSTTKRPGRTPIAGKSYYFYEEWDGTNLTFFNSIIDLRDGNVYKIVTIGTQVWMAENLKATKYNDGTVITDGNEGTWKNYTSGAYCDYGNNSSNSVTYGRLYNWYAVSSTTNGNKNICPTGWHVPTDAEWTTLTTYLGGESVAGGKLKESGTSHWNSPNTGATNSSGFTALPGGYRTDYGDFKNVKNFGYWWSSTQSANIYCRFMRHDSSAAGTKYHKRTYGFSVRCVRD